MNSTFLRYALVGLLTNAGGYAIYLFITWLGVTPKMAMSLLYFVGVIMGFFWHRQWAFSHQGNALASLLRYGLSHILGYGLNFIILMLFVDALDYQHQLVQGVAILAVAVFLFLLFRFFVFSRDNSIGETI